VKGVDILKRGMSLVKNYSEMSEDERKELIKKAFEAKKQLEEELKETKLSVLACFNKFYVCLYICYNRF
jgi:diadenosine tetraphosphate (Ap4A) HIT family hydrolase